jgi:hypothetical protein
MVQNTEFLEGSVVNFGSARFFGGTVSFDGA